MQCLSDELNKFCNPIKYNDKIRNVRLFLKALFQGIFKKVLKGFSNYFSGKSSLLRIKLDIALMDMRDLHHILIGCCLVFWLGITSLGGAYAQETQTENPLAVKKPRGQITITSDGEVKIDNVEKIITYTDNVKVVQDDMTMFSDTLAINLDQTGRTLEKAVATGNVRLVRDAITATGELGTFYDQDQKLEIEGKAKVWQGNNTIIAHRIVYFLGQEIVEGYGTSSDRVVMTVYQQKKAQSPEPTPKDTANNPRQDTSPIIIIADTLQLDNPAQKATYTGNVIVTQNTTEIRSDKMLVYISRTEEAGDDIEKIEVFGNVRITRDNTTVTGEKGVYLNKEQHVRVEGTSDKKARAEDKTQNMILEAPVIEAFLTTNIIKAIGRARTFFGPAQSEESGSPNMTPTPGNETKQNPQDLPSVTLFPGKKEMKR